MAYEAGCRLRAPKNPTEARASGPSSRRHRRGLDRIGRLRANYARASRGCEAGAEDRDRAPPRCPRDSARQASRDGGPPHLTIGGATARGRRDARERSRDALSRRGSGRRPLATSRAADARIRSGSKTRTPPAAPSLSATAPLRRCGWRTRPERRPYGGLVRRPQMGAPPRRTGHTARHKPFPVSQ